MKKTKKRRKTGRRFLLVLATAAIAAALARSDFHPFHRVGWVEEDGQFYYYNEEEQLHTGWLRLPEGTYFLDEYGVRMSGWLREDNDLHYFDENGLMVMDGWVGSGSSRRLIREGMAVYGLQEYEGQTCYLDGSGYPVTGWLELEDGLRYFDPEDGFSVTGIHTIDGISYGFDGLGFLTSGWLDVDGRIYYLTREGTPLPGGWQEIEGTTYYLDDDGSLAQGWVTAGGHTYYMEDGIYVTGILALDGRNYYFDTRGWQVLLVNAWNPAPDGYEPTLTSVGGDHSIASHAAQDFSNMIYTLQQLEMGPIITSSYRSIGRQQEIFDERMAGYMAQGMGEKEAYALTATAVALPGTSEHQLGLAMDLTDALYNQLDEGQMETPTQLWLMENCWRFGFILRYPEGKSDITGIIYEPWHYRHVGKELAADLHRLGLTLEEYMDSITPDKSLTASDPANGNTMK